MRDLSSRETGFRKESATRSDLNDHRECLTASWKRLPSIRLMEDELSRTFASARAGFLSKIAMFVPYTFKDMVDIDLVEFLAIEHLKMLNYITGVQRLCVPEDILSYAFWNTDAEGDRLLIKGTSGTTCVVGWHEVAVAFGANHLDTEEFRAIRINNKNFSEYSPGEYLLETVETNAARKLVNGRPYEEISYYKEAAPYSPTFFLMSMIAELFWCNGRSTRYTTPMVYAYMRSLHGFQTNWAKVILHYLKTEIQFLQKRARAPDNTKVIPIIWALVFVRILYTFRQTIFSSTSLEAADAWVSWIHMSKDGEIDGRALHTKYPNPIGDLKVIRKRCKLTDKIPLAEPVNGDSVPMPTATMAVKLPARKRPRDVEDGNDDDYNTTPPRTVRTRLTSRTPSAVGAAAGDVGTSTVPTHIDGDSNELREFGHKIGPLLGDIVSKLLKGSLSHLLAEANAGQLLPKQVADLAKKLKEAESSRTDLNDRVVALKAELEVDLQKARQEVTTRASEEAKLKAQLKALAEDAEKAKVNSANQETKLQQEVYAMQKQLQGQSSTADRYIRELQLEMKKATDLDNQVVLLQGQVESHKFTAERAEKAQVALRLELNQVKTDLRMMQISGSSS
ncbi:hypothetical protein R1sor_001003 [Riccia sorocarpa]|uniref:Aminotransferase-like plant mobile domain-containing protein n=1 Tax=Riccia sorocarpa TaxID=122646 RepID=A0ABD3GWP8_9MARC